MCLSFFLYLDMTSEVPSVDSESIIIYSNSLYDCSKTLLMVFSMPWTLFLTTVMIDIFIIIPGLKIQC